MKKINLTIKWIITLSSAYLFVESENLGLVGWLAIVIGIICCSSFIFEIVNDITVRQKRIDDFLDKQEQISKSK